eukprot:CAMPEP_0182422010 /NCGR_PEP_ID=MMETSP1167-20130531/7598_1 /TAXON_ID=2988 /ORGANISM="Mallomonas Sp, Strain CCMP3275" /LENGTH=190 /DNA_ID=CAMNT_0024599711 /DNA_START=239 /DNA_END=811 /DNA_ORIENTATION=+
MLGNKITEACAEMSIQPTDSFFQMRDSNAFQYIKKPRARAEYEDLFQSDNTMHIHKFLYGASDLTSLPLVFQVSSQQMGEFLLENECRRFASSHSSTSSADDKTNNTYDRTPILPKYNDIMQRIDTSILQERIPFDTIYISDLVRKSQQRVSVSRSMNFRREVRRVVGRMETATPQKAKDKIKKITPKAF